MPAARYVALNPVRARLVGRAQDWPWSSVRAHLAGRDDALVSVRPVLDRAPRFDDVIEGEPAFLGTIARQLGRAVAPGKRGRKPRNAAEGAIKKGITGV